MGTVQPGPKRLRQRPVNRPRLWDDSSWCQKSQLSCRLLTLWDSFKFRGRHPAQIPWSRRWMNQMR